MHSYGSLPLRVGPPICHVYFIASAKKKKKGKPAYVCLHIKYQETHVRALLQSFNLLGGLVRRVQITNNKFMRNSVQTNSCSDEFLFRRIHVQTNSCSDEFMFRRIHVQTNLCSDEFMFHTNSCSDEFLFRRILVQTNSCSDEVLFRRISVQTKSCSDEFLFRRSPVRTNPCSEEFMWGRGRFCEIL